MRKLSVIAFSLSLLAAAPTFDLTPEIRDAINRVDPDSLRGNLSFLASDLLAGRDTPSPGLEIAAEFIAAQFRKSGLEPGGDRDYLQTVKLVMQEPNLDGFELSLTDGGSAVKADPAEVSIRNHAAIDISQAPVFKLDLKDAALVEKLTPEQLDGKVVLLEPGGNRSAMAKIRGAKPAVTITIQRREPSPNRGGGQLFDPEDKTPQSVRITAASPAIARFYDSLQPGLSPTATASLHAAAPKERQLALHNVVGILRGSDPALKDTCVLLSAHYDHIGEKPTGEGDRIYNGANDDGSGTVSVIEIANALAHLKQRPKRSIVFVTFFGEEKGGYGSRYYARHPSIPLDKTIADINLEQVGRSDSTEGEQKNNASITGFDYSDVAEVLQAAGGLTGIEVYKNNRANDVYFSASDNVFLAEQGVPAHSLTVAFDYADYHGLGDEWQKIDYENMAKVDRMVAVGLLMLAGDTRVPHWNPENPKAAPYLKAWKKAHPEQ
jgi:hypothetical protein